VDIKNKIIFGFLQTLQSNKESISYVVFYTLVEGVLVLAIPLTSSFVINSLIAHSYVSLMSLGFIISIIFIGIIFLRLIQEYIIEKFQQRVFVKEGFDVGEKAFNFKKENKTTHYPIDKLMNYFFDITTIQKVFPIFILNGTALIVQIFLTLLLLLVFSMHLFFGALVLIVINILLIIFFGKNGVKFSLERSDAKHEAIHYLQKIPSSDVAEKEMFDGLEKRMSHYVDARQNHFGIRLKQFGITFVIQGIMIAGFFVLGGYLVINGNMPIGEFVASEIIVVTLITALNSFVKQLDYIYEGIEGYYKVEILSSSLEGEGDLHVV